jgi:putative oxidoreductase
MKILHLILRLAVSVILLQTLYFKFTGQPESIYIFSTIGLEPWGRIGSGIVELVAGIALLVPAFVGIGAILTLGTMSGAVFFHLTTLGVEVQEDGGTLFFMALFCFISSVWISWKYKHQIPLIKNFFT